MEFKDEVVSSMRAMDLLNSANSLHKIAKKTAMARNLVGMMSLIAPTQPGTEADAIRQQAIDKVSRNTVEIYSQLAEPYGVSVEDFLARLELIAEAPAAFALTTYEGKPHITGVTLLGPTNDAIWEAVEISQDLADRLLAANAIPQATHTGAPIEADAPRRVRREGEYNGTRERVASQFGEDFVKQMDAKGEAEGNPKCPDCGLHHPTE